MRLFEIDDIVILSTGINCFFYEVGGQEKDFADLPT